MSLCVENGLGFTMRGNTCSFATVMLPFQTVMFPLYKDLVTLNMLNTLWGVRAGFQLAFQGLTYFFTAGLLKLCHLSLRKQLKSTAVTLTGHTSNRISASKANYYDGGCAFAALGIWNDYRRSRWS